MDASSIWGISDISEAIQVTIDTASDTVSRTIPIMCTVPDIRGEFEFPHGLAVHPNGASLYVTLPRCDPSPCHQHRHTHGDAAHIQPRSDNAHRAVAVSPDGAFVYMGGRFAVYVFTANGTFIARIPVVGSRPTAWQ